MDKKVIVITGGTGGIGKAMASRMANQNYNVVITYIVEDEKEQAEKLLQQIQEETGCEGMAVHTDVTDYKSCEALVQKVKDKFGRIDVLANNAGISCQPGPFHEMDLEQVDGTLDVNLKGVMHCTRAALPLMLQNEKGGCVVNVASIAGLMHTPGNAEYSASKAGVIGFTRGIAGDYAQKNIRCNAIAPGVIETPMTEGMDDEAMESMGIPMGRAGQPEDIADCLEYIVRANYLTGQTISPNGGIVMP